ncbi:MAG: VanZ family protein [Clostridiales bacterium]|nr:VanZ family protein [Clostridiales bacterium]
MKQNAVKVICSFIFGAILGYLLYYYVMMDVLSVFFGGGAFYVIVSLLCLLLCVGGCSAVFYLLLTGRIKKWMLWLLFAAYFCAAVIALFGRRSMGRVFIWNPLTGIRDLHNLEMQLQSLLNLLLFIPVGYFFRNSGIKQSLLAGFLLAVSVELLQVAVMRGMFDTFDIILYVIGFFLGVLLFKKWKIKVVD